MLPKLTPEAQGWVDATLASMTLEERVGHLLCPEDRNYTVDAWRAIMRDVPLGAVFFGLNEPARLRACLEAVQEEARIPVLVASDLEHGAGIMVQGCVQFPMAMACGAANDPDLVAKMGRATAREGRAHGIHWTFSPVVDLNRNFQNPVTNIRSLGDDPAHVAPLARAWIQGMQASGELAACAKHFPGDGVDDRDQHCCTSVNSLSVARWWATYGQMWRAAIEAGVLSVMVGHIAFPAYEGLADDPRAAMPGTLSPRLQIDLLRGELGFEGVIVSDAAPMIGISSRVPAEEKAVQNILTGSDVFLFADPREDFARLLQAAREGPLTEERLERSVRRVLEMKARLGLHRGVFGPPVAEPERARFLGDAAALADKSVTLLRANQDTPIHLEPDAKVLTITIKHPEAGKRNHDLTVVDDELRARGFQVDHLVMPSSQEILDVVDDYDAVFVNLLLVTHSLMGTIRLTGSLIMAFWNSFWPGREKIIFTSFGSPYHLYELPHLPNMYLTYSPTEVSQAAAVKVWLGELAPQGECPVQQPVR